MRIGRPHNTNEPGPFILFIVGPTAIGKTSLAVKLAKKMRGEIISCDSMQVYKSMGMLSQAPSKSERKFVRHHLVEILDPNKEYSVAAFIGKEKPIIKSIIKRGKTPIVAGGSGLYIKALIDGLFPSPDADMKFRNKMQKFARRYGSGKLHKCGSCPTSTSRTASGNCYRDRCGQVRRSEVAKVQRSSASARTAAP